MGKAVWKKLLLLLPIFILIGTLLFVNYTVQYFKDLAYHFTYKTNTESLSRFSMELQLLDSEGYSLDEFSEYYIKVVQVYNRTFGEKNAIKTFLIDEAGEIFHSSVYNKEYVAPVLRNLDNMNKVKSVMDTRISGEIQLGDGQSEETWYYQKLSIGNKAYFIFMSIYKHEIEAQLNANNITIPISIMGLLLLIAIEVIIWMRIEYVPFADVKKGDT